MSLQPGTVLSGAYRIVRLIGRGGMGEVYEVLHERTGASFAIKILAGAPEGNDELFERFRREAEVTSRLKHPHIVKVFDFDRLPDGRPFLAMELLTGSDLAALGTSQGFPLPVARVVSIVDQISLALFAAHQAGVVHRDLKPANIFIESLPGSDRDLVRVLDFGISKLRNATGGLTRTAAVIGTPHYMSPEQATGRSKNIDERSDQFSLGTIAYELLTGRRAFATASADEDDDAMLAIMYRVVHEEPPAWSSLGLALPVGLEQVVRRAMAKSPADRYPTIRALSAAFAAAADESAAPLSVTAPLSPPVVAPTLLAPPAGPPPPDRAVPSTLLLPQNPPRGNTTLSLAAGETAGGAAARAGSGTTTAISARRSTGKVVVVSAVALVALVTVGIIALRPSPAVTSALAPAATPAPVTEPAAVAPVAPVVRAVEKIVVPAPSAVPVAPPLPAVVSIELDDAPEGLTVLEGDRTLPLPLSLPNDGRGHHLTFRAPARRDLAVDVVGRPGGHLSLRRMEPRRATPPGHVAPRSKTKVAPAPTRNEDIL